MDDLLFFFIRIGQFPIAISGMNWSWGWKVLMRKILCLSSFCALLLAFFKKSILFLLHARIAAWWSRARGYTPCKEDFAKSDDVLLKIIFLGADFSDCHELAVMNDVLAFLWTCRM